MTAERTSPFGAQALVGPCSIGRAARIARRQLQPGSDWLRASVDGGLVIDPEGPNRVIDSGGVRTKLAHWVAALREAFRRMTRSTATAVSPPSPASRLHVRASVGAPRTRRRWHRASLLAAFITLFVLGMAVQHRAEIVNWPVLVAALAGRNFESTRTTSKSESPTRIALGIESPRPQTTPGARPPVPTPVPGRPLPNLPDPLPGPDASLLDQRPGQAARRTTHHASRTLETQSEDDEDPVSVELRGNANQAAHKVDDPVDVTLAAPNPPASAPPATSLPAKQPVKAVTVNGGALVVRSATGKFQQVAPGERLPNGQTLTGIDEADGTFTTNAGTFNFGEAN